MKIVHVLASLSTRAGGPPRVAMSIAAELAKAGHEVTVVAYEGDSRDSTVVNTASSHSGFDAVDIQTIPGPAAIERVLARQAQRMLEPLVNRSDVVHLHGVWETSLAAAASIARSQRKRIVVTPHGMLADYGMRLHSIKKHVALVIYARSVVESADAVHALTATEAGQIRKYAPNARTVVIPNAINPRDFSPQVNCDLFRTQHPNIAVDPYFLFLSRVDHMKGVDRLVDAFSHLSTRHPRAHLVIAGPDFGARAPAEARTLELKLGTRVHFVGELLGDEKTSALAGAICLCQPSRHEGFPVSVIEALACGSPVVVSSAVDIDGLVPTGAGIITSDRPEDIAAAMERFLVDTSLRQKASTAARQLVASSYTWPIVTTKILDIYSPDPANGSPPIRGQADQEKPGKSI